ncbi:MAG: hypothetical protein ACYC2E_11715 [Sulfuricella sp.]
MFSELLGAAASALRTVIGVAANVASTAIRVVQIEYGKLQKKYQGINIDQLKKDRFDQLKEANDEIIDLERAVRQGKSLRPDDQERLDHLYQKRQKLRGKIEAAKEFEVAKDIAENGSEYGEKLVDKQNPNELTRLGGQVVMGKLCQICKNQGIERPMAIRWATDIREPVITDLFWGCTGFFFKTANGDPSCKYTEKFSNRDINLFGQLDRPGMELPAAKLNDIVLKPATSKHIEGKLASAVNEATENYLCPVHNEKMTLKTKENAQDILDLYYLRCARCNQMVKIKSATQLDAVLEAFNGQGLFKG